LTARKVRLLLALALLAVLTLIPVTPLVHAQPPKGRVYTYKGNIDWNLTVHGFMNETQNGTLSCVFTVKVVPVDVSSSNITFNVTLESINCTATGVAKNFGNVTLNLFGNGLSKANSTITVTLPKDYKPELNVTSENESSSGSSVIFYYSPSHMKGKGIIEVSYNKTVNGASIVYHGRYVYDTKTGMLKSAEISIASNNGFLEMRGNSTVKLVGESGGQAGHGKTAEYAVILLVIIAVAVAALAVKR